MERKKQIEEAAKIPYHPYGGQRTAFIEGAQWADANPPHTKPDDVTEDVTEACVSSAREWWIDPISDFEDEDCDPVLTAYTRHPGQGPLDFQARLIKVVPASEVEKVKQSEFDRGWKAAIEFANAAWKPFLNPPKGGADE